MPVLSKEGACKRCKQKFDVTKDSASSCSCHVDSEGETVTERREIDLTDSYLVSSLSPLGADGIFREMIVPDTLSASGYRKQKCWTCCRQTDVNAPGCLTRPHVCKELMLSIRAESGIPASIADIDLTIFQTLEITVFPGCEYCIHVQISSQVLEMLHSYFEISDKIMIDEDEVGEGDDLRGGSGVDGEGETRKTSKDDERSLGLNLERSVSDVPNESPSADPNHSPNLSKQNSEEIPSHHSNSPQDVVTQTTTVTTNNNPSSSSSSVTRQEALFIKYLRVGHIAVEVNTIGFAFNLEKYKAIVNEFSLRNKVLDWHRLIWKFEMHIALCMTSHTATSSMNKLWTIMFGKSDEGNDQTKGMNRYLDDDMTAKKILLLGE
jgi:hypothetical protein